MRAPGPGPVPVSLEVRRSLLGSTTPHVGSSHREKIRIAHRADVIDRELHEGLRLAGQPDEFNFDSVSAMHVNNRAKVALAKSVLRDIAFEDDSIELVDTHGVLAGYAVTRRGTAPPEGMSQTVRTGKGTPLGPCSSPGPVQR